MITDRNGVIDKISKNQIDRVMLDIGCGESKISPEFIGIDKLHYGSVDIVGDVFDVLRSIPAGSVDKIYTSHFLEHITGIREILIEFARVLKSDGEVEIVVPHFSNPYYFSDPTHKTYFGLYSMVYFVSGETQFRRKTPMYDKPLGLELFDVRLRFQTTKGFIIRSAIKKTVERIVNWTTFTQELYEESFCYICPCYDVRFRLHKYAKAAGIDQEQ